MLSAQAVLLAPQLQQKVGDGVAELKEWRRARVRVGEAAASAACMGVAQLAHYHRQQLLLIEERQVDHIASSVLQCQQCHQYLGWAGLAQLEVTRQSTQAQATSAHTQTLNAANLAGAWPQETPGHSK